MGNSVNFHLDSQIDVVEIDNGKRNFHTFAAQTNEDKMFNRATRIIKRFCDQLELRENIIRHVEDLYYQIMDLKDLKGKKLEKIVASCIYYVCKTNMVNLHPKDLKPLVGSKDNKIKKFAKIIKDFTGCTNVEAADYVKLYGRELKLKSAEVEEMVHICKGIKDFDFFQSKQPKPRSTAASVIYFYLRHFSKDKKSLAQIKEVSGIVTDTTITAYLNHFEKNMKFIKDIIRDAAPASIKAVKKVKF